MLKVLAAIDSHPDQEEATHMKTMINRSKKLKCACCSGLGHTSKSCTSKKLIDKAVKAVGLRSYWGEVKSKLKMDTYSLRREIAVQIREEGREVEAPEADPLARDLFRSAHKMQTESPAKTVLDSLAKTGKLPL